MDRQQQQKTEHKTECLMNKGGGWHLMLMNLMIQHDLILQQLLVEADDMAITSTFYGFSDNSKVKHNKIAAVDFIVLVIFSSVRKRKSHKCNLCK